MLPFLSRLGLSQVESVDKDTTVVLSRSARAHD